MFSKETVILFDNLLNQVSIPAKDPDFDSVAAVISTAKKELETVKKELGIISEPTPEVTTPDGNSNPA